MNKEQYKRLLNMRKSEEEMFFALIKYYGNFDITPREIIKSFPINHKRAWYLLGKFCLQKRYNYGVNLELGWVEENETRT